MIMVVKSHVKVMKHDKLAKSHGILLSIMEFHQFYLRIVPDLRILPSLRNSALINVESLHFPMLSTNRYKCKIEKRDGHGKLRNGHGKVMKK